MDFGEIGSLFNGGAARGNGASPVGFGQSFSTDGIVVGDVVNAQINRAILLGDENIFLWGHDKWASNSKKVGR